MAIKRRLRRLARKSMYYCYILYSEKSSYFYIDSTQDLERGLSMHNNAMFASTKPFIPWELAWYHEFESEKDAKDCELYLKSNRGRDYAYKTLIASFRERREQDSIYES